MSDIPEQHPSESPQGDSSQAPETGAPETETPETDTPETSSTEPRMADDARSQWRALQAVLRRTETAHRGPVLLEGSLWYLVTALSVFLGVLLIAAIVPAVAGTVAGWMLLVGEAAAVVAAAVALGLFVSRRRDPLAIARDLQHHHPELRNDLVAALEFGEALAADSDSDPGFSRTLAEAHIVRTVRRVWDLQQDGHLAHLLPRRDLRVPALSVAAVAAVAAVVVGVWPNWVFDTLPGGASGSGTAASRAELQPIVGSLDIAVNHPAYTGLGRQFVRGSTGHIETLVGTELTIATRQLVPEGSRVEIVLTTDSGAQTIAMQPVGADVLQTTLLATESGLYAFRATLPDGRVVTDGIDRTLRLVPDEAPEVTITSHDERELEVRPDDVLELRFAVGDDFGIGAVEWVHHFEGGEDDLVRRTVEMPELSTTPRSATGAITFDLAPLGLQPKDSLLVYVEARDNNNVTGPGVGRSEPIVLYVSSPEDKHLKNIADQQMLHEALLLHLADFLEAPVGAREPRANDTYRQQVEAALPIDERRPRADRIHEIHRARVPLLEAMANLVDALGDDPLMLKRDVTFMASFRDQLTELQGEGDRVFTRLEARSFGGTELTLAQLQSVADYAAKSEDTLEKGLIRLDELLAAQKMEAIKATAEDIRELKDRLRELLERYRDTQDPELKAAIRREIQRLRQRMAELMARMQMQLQKLPQEHVNMEAVQQAQLESDTKQLADGLQNIEEMLENDDIDGALAALDQMDQALDALTQEMGEAFEQSEPQGVSELDEKIAELMDRVNDLESQEKAIERETRELQEELGERRREATERMLDPFTESMLRKIAEQERHLERLEARELPERDRPLVDEARKKLQSLREMVEQQDVEGGLDRARSTLDTLRSLRQMMSLSQRYVPAGSDEHRTIAEGLRDLGQLVPGGEQIVRDFEDIMSQARQQMQGQDRQRLEELAGRQQRAAEQAQQLRQEFEEAGQRFPQLQQQLTPRLDQARDAMDNAEEGLRQGETQRALDSERQALEQLGQLKQDMRDALQRERNEQQRQGRQSGAEKVEIPTQDSRQAHERFRKEMMDGMREGRLEDYQSEIERYYKSLVE